MVAFNNFFVSYTLKSIKAINSGLLVSKMASNALTMM